MSATVDHLAEVRRRFLAADLRGRDATDVVVALVDEVAPLAPPEERDAIIAAAAAELVGLGPLEAHLADPEVTDVLVTGDGRVWVDRDGRARPTGVVLAEPEVTLAVERAFRHTGSGVDRARPIGEARLAGGARISVVLPPLAPDGVQVAIRNFPERPRRLDELAAPPVAAELRRLVAARANIVVFGATGSGKTTLVGALGAEVDPAERVVTIEDAAELRLGLPHVVRLEARTANGDGVGEVPMRRLVRTALRLRPDRIVVGEVRGPEALDMVWAMSSGHDGSMSTVHARTAVGALQRLETFVLLADADLPLGAVRSQVAAAVDVLVGVRRHGPDRRVVSVHRMADDGAGGRRPVPMWTLEASS